MTKEKLTHEYIVPYFEKGFEIEILNYKCDYVGIKYAKAKGMYQMAGELYVEYEGGSAGKTTGSYKPILKPLSDIYSNIVINGTMFVPWMRLTMFNSQEELSHALKNIDIFMPYGAVKMLIEWSFDVFGLIEKGLATDINTIKDLKYGKIYG